MSTTTSRPAIRPDSDELTELLARISAGAEEREREVKAPFEAISWIKQAGVGRLRIPVEEGGAGLRCGAVRHADRSGGGRFQGRAYPAHSLLVRGAAPRQADPHARLAGSPAEAGDLVGNGFSEKSKKAVGLNFDTEFTPDQ